MVSHATLAASAGTIPAGIRRFLEAPRIATISTLNPDGSPHQAVVWYDLDGDDLVLNSRPDRRWPANLGRDPRISIAVPEADRPYHWVGLAGRAAELRRGPQAVADIQALARRYGRPEAPYAGQDRVTFRVTVERTYEYDS